MKTLDFQDKADEARQRRMEERAMKTEWLKEQSEVQHRLRETNNEDRDERAANIKL